MDANAKLNGLRLVTVANANRPIHLVGIPSDPETSLIAERGGTVREAKGLRTATTPVQLSEPILEIATSQNSERGLLSLAIHPDDPSKIYVFYNRMGNNNSVVQEFTRNQETGKATAGRILYDAAHQAGNHQGGNIAFGPDKMLYIPIGDNGGELARGKALSFDLGTNFGKILRMDAATMMPASGNRMGLIWSLGLRNPWRMSFDRKTGDLYIGDVGFRREEVNFHRAGQPGTDFGWSDGGTGAGAPVYSYPNPGGGNCVIGGYVYRGTKNGCMHGRYFFKDRDRPSAQSFVVQNGMMTDLRTHANLTSNDLYSFGEDSAGEVYMLTGGNGMNNSGRVARIVE